MRSRSNRRRRGRPRRPMYTASTGQRRSHLSLGRCISPNAQAAGHPRRRGRRPRTSWGSASRRCAGSTSNHLRVFCTTPTAVPIKNLVLAAVRAPLTLPTSAFVGRQSHGVATPRALPPGRSFKERLFAALGAHLSSHCYSTVLVYVYVCMCVCVTTLGDRLSLVKISMAGPPGPTPYASAAISTGGPVLATAGGGSSRMPPWHRKGGLGGGSAIEGSVRVATRRTDSPCSATGRSMKPNIDLLLDIDSSATNLLGFAVRDVKAPDLKPIRCSKSSHHRPAKSSLEPVLRLGTLMSRSHRRLTS